MELSNQLNRNHSIFFSRNLMKMPNLRPSDTVSK